MVNALIVTHSASLRSTTCVLDALIKNEHNKSFNVSLVCSSDGPWIDELKNNSVTCYKHPFNVPDLKKPLTFIKDFLFWVKLIKKEKIKIVHVNEHEVFSVVRHAANFCNIPVVVGIRFILNESFANWLFGGKCKPAKLMFTSNNQYQNSIKNFPLYAQGETSTVLGNGRDYDDLINKVKTASIPAFKKGWQLPESSFVLGTASSIRPRKKIEDFVYIVKNLLDKNIDVVGVIAGGGKYADAEYEVGIKQLIIDLKLESKIIMTGNLEDLSAFYASIDLFISTSELETFGMSVSEAMAVNKPTIGYTGGSVEEVIGNEWCIAPIGNIDLLTQKSEAIINDKALYNNLAASGKERILANYTAQSLASKLKAIYLEAIAQNNKY